jgi:hypothetical protein
MLDRWSIAYPMIRFDACNARFAMQSAETTLTQAEEAVQANKHFKRLQGASSLAMTLPTRTSWNVLRATKSSCACLVWGQADQHGLAALPCGPPLSRAAHEVAAAKLLKPQHPHAPAVLHVGTHPIGCKFIELRLSHGRIRALELPARF